MIIIVKERAKFMYNKRIIDSNRIFKSVLQINGVIDCFVATLDGIPTGKVDRDSSIISATSAAILGAIGEMMRNLNFGMLEQLIVETDFGRIVLEDVEDEYVIIVISEKNANIGLIKVMLKKTLEKFKGELLSSKTESSHEDHISKINDEISNVSSAVQNLKDS